MIEWEYTILSPCPRRWWYSHPDLMYEGRDLLNKLGKDGWELVAVTSNDDVPEAIFKRPKEHL